MSSVTELTALRERLLALPDDALKEFAKRAGIDVPGGVAKVLLIDLFLEVLEDEFEDQDSQNNDSVRLKRLKYDLSYIEKIEEENEGPAFSGQYNDTRIVLMLRDPFWAFAYWDIKGGTLKSIKKEREADTVILRVSRLKGAYSSAPGQTVLDSFDIPIRIADSSWYINIPRQGAYYSAALVLQGKTWERPLITSNTIWVPAPPPPDGWPEIVILSEAEKLDVAQPEEASVPGPQKSFPQRISSPETAQFLEGDS